MKITNLYGLFIGKKSTFINSFADEQLQEQAKSFWSKLDGGALFFLLAFLLLAIAFAWVYYKPYNEMPGRHFRPSHWMGFGVVTLIVTFIVTFVIALIVAPSKLPGTMAIDFKIAIANVLYAACVYLIVSFCFCMGWFGKTNAYKYLKP